MPTLSIETREIEAWLSGTQQPAESLLFQARLILQPELKDKVQWQQKTYRLVRLYGRQQIRAEIAEVENMLLIMSRTSASAKRSSGSLSDSPAPQP
jgi:hypothetical protein